MTIKALVAGQSVNLSLGGYSAEGFRLVDGSGAYEDFFLPTCLPLDAAFEGKEFDVFYLARKELRENDIYQVYDDTRKARIGWCIPVNALDSAEHDFSGNIHFQRYAYVAIKNAITNIGDDIYTKEIDIGVVPEIRLADIFHSNTAILVISREALAENRAFEIESAIPSLIRYGYVRLTKKSPGDVVLSGSRPESGKLKLKLTSSSLSSHRVIDSLLHSAFAYETNAVLCFFYLYQIFELLLEEIYQVEQSKIIDDLILAAGDSSKAKDALEKAQRISSEKKRISLLTTEYSRSLEKVANLKASCNVLLKAVGRNEGKSFEEYFYSIRNFIFHQYRDFPVEKEQLLHEVVDDVREWLPEVLSTFSAPSQITI